MRFGWMAALALMLTPAAAMAQDSPRKVLFSGPGLALLVPETITGPRNHRTVELMIVFTELVDGGDVHLNPWVIDCTAMTAQPLNGRAFLGAKFVHDTATERPAKPIESERMEGIIADYACKGTRESADAATLRTFPEAVDYGRKLATE